MENNVKPFGIRRHLDYFFTKIFLSIQKMKEYKADFYSMMFFDIILLISYIIAYTVIGNLISPFLNWKIGDFFLLFCFSLLAWKILWIHNLRGFSSRLLKGELNIAMVKPINVYFNIATEQINFQNIISGFGLFLLAVIYIIYDQSYENFLLAFFIFIFGSVYLVVIFNFIQSFSFFIKRNEFIYNIVFDTEGLINKYTPKTFEGTSISYLFYLFPASIGFFLIEALNGRIKQFLFYFPYLLFSFFVLILGTYILWHYGLKKYEAFG